MTQNTNARRFTILLQAATPIAHGDTTTGVDNATNTRLFMRQGMLVGGIPARVPAISENALRSVLLREPLADHLVQTLGIERGTLPQSVMNLIYAGGNMAAGSKAPAQEVAYGHAVKRLYPSIDLLGGSVDAFILPRSRLRISAWLVAREYADAIAHVAPELLEAASQCSAFDMLTEETRTRGTGSNSSGNQMIYTYETLAAGSQILVEITLDAHTPPAAVAAVGHALAVWDGYIGGQNRQGRGRCIIKEDSLPDAAPYLAHLQEHGEAMRDGLVNGTLGVEARLCAA